MDAPRSPNAICDKQRTHSSPSDSARSSFWPSRSERAAVETQLKLRSLYEFMDTGRAALTEIGADVRIFGSNPDDVLHHKRASERLSQFCSEADAWGFDDLYRIGLALQRLLLGSRDRARGRAYWEAFFGGLEMLSALLEQCESDVCRRLVIDDMLHSLDPVDLC